MNCYLWELEGILEGLALKQIDEREQQAIFSFNLRYVLNASKPKLTKVFDKKKAEKRIKDIFKREKGISEKTDRTNKVKDVMNYFKNKKWG
ncbi:hypothetical protein [Enterococcus faecium]|uniref:hypothetical protein n=1 Tax=Enterococcus faecium TaxID=1352 RepID=UPI000BF00FD1|nr:hypothetical protein [Enterococcus faecium]PEH49300.1 hypothetical protein CRM75_16105 [Enterococcus faecium]